MASGPSKERLDVLLSRRGLCASRERARALVMLGHVLVDGKPCVKAGTRLAAAAEITVVAPSSPFVSRGGEKLAGALDALRIAVAGRDALDIGASTGGFTDCLLQRGARRVTALDVGRAQLHPSLQSDPRVSAMERRNFRLTSPADFPHLFHLITVDVSFISLAHILPGAARLLHPGGRILALVKPQFEAGKGKVGKGGVVRDPQIHRDVLRAAARRAPAAGLRPAAVVLSPLKGPKGNIEFFMLFETITTAAPPDLNAAIEAAVNTAHEIKSTTNDTNK